MRKRIAAVALVLALPLSGCVLAIGNSPDEDGKSTGKRLQAIEKRLEALEAKGGAYLPAGVVMVQGNGVAVEAEATAK